MTTGDAAVYQFVNLPGLVPLQSLATKAMLLGFLCSMASALYQRITRGECDMVTPFMRLLAASAVLGGSPFIGSFLGDLADYLGNTVGDQAAQELFAQVIGDKAAEINGVGSLVMRLGFASFSSSLYLAMYIVKLVVIDTIFPVLFNFMLVLGLVVAPLSTFPSAHGLLAKWLLNMVELTLWPLIYSLLLAISTSSFKGLLEIVSELNVGTFLSDMATLAWDSSDSLSADSTMHLWTLYQFTAFCIVYVLLSLFTPILAHTVARGSSVGTLGGILAAKASGALAGLASFGAQSGLGRYTALSSAGAAAGGGGGFAGQVHVKAAANEDAPPDLNERQNEPPRAREGQP